MQPSLWSFSEFRTFLVANTISRFCASGLSVLLGFQIYELTHDPFYLGLLGLMQAIPGVTLVLYGGDVADRRSRRRIVYRSFGALALLSAVLAYASKDGQQAVPAIFLVAIAFRVGEKPALHKGGDGSQVWTRIKEGISYVFGNQLLVGSMALDLFAVFFAGANALLPIVATEVLHVGAEGFGLLRSATAAGALTAAMLATRFLSMEKAGRMLHAVIAVFGVSIIVFGLSQSFALSLAALFVAGLCDGGSMVIRHTILRLASPDALRGRIAAVKSVFVGSANELGSFQSGMTASVIGAAPALCAGGVITLVVVVTVALRAPELWNLDLGKQSTAPQCAFRSPLCAQPVRRASIIAKMA